jgi:hypothetical protein
MILIELTAAIDAAGTLRTFYVSTGGFVTSPTDMPPNTAFEPCVMDPGSIGLHAFSDGRTGGTTKLEAGEIVLANIDGSLDGWKNYSFDGRPIAIRSGQGGSYPTSWPAIMAGTAESVEVTSKQVVIKLRDKQYRFTTPIRTAMYGGTNVLPDGLDGMPGDLQGKARPGAFGKVFNVSPPMVNTSRLILEVGPCQSVDAAYSNGAGLTPGTAYASQADMEANSPAAGFFRAWPAGGYIRLGLYNGEQVTVDLTQGATAADRTVAQVLRNLALAAGLTAGEVSAADVAALDALSSAVVGIWISDAGTTFASAMDQVAASIGAWYGFDAAGVLRMGQLTAPTGAPKATLHDWDIMPSMERRPPKDNGTPIWSATVNHTKIWTVQTSGLAGSAAGRRGYLDKEYRSANAPDASIKTQWLMAGVLEVDGLLTSTADATPEAARLLALYKVRRDIFDVPVHISAITKNGLGIMDVVSIAYPRYDLASGRLLRVIGISLNLANETATLTVWG